MTSKAYWRGYEVYEIDYRHHDGVCEVLFRTNDYESPWTGTGRQIVRMDEITVVVA